MGLDVLGRLRSRWTSASVIRGGPVAYLPCLVACGCDIGTRDAHRLCHSLLLLLPSPSLPLLVSPSPLLPPAWSECRPWTAALKEFKPSLLSLTGEPPAPPMTVMPSFNADGSD